ncbi:hypothetical protein Moror_9358 [Moniliophthora roreri MCA 2997]|uniref:Uncharacterized protein n=1 Tax=Moniliophthora roreri (strain MCA 2997) TaxID=1381753 RepID=V2WWX5_MONRO|nr:hypothetical protein Moror_9358 [Moniliophthora roreri MCA 2997]
MAIVFTAKEANNDCGTSPACAKGISHSSGQKEPQILRHSESTNKALENLAALPVFKHLSGQANYLLNFYALCAFAFQKDGLGKLINYYKHLKLNYNDTAFAACMWNFRPQFTSYPHLNANNSLFTWCAITAMGDYDPTHRGHLILWDFGLIICFPPGATILIPSTLLIHSNTLIQPGETRYSFVQYSAGALFHWVHNSFQTAERWLANATDAMLQDQKREDGERVANSLKMFSTVEEIANCCHCYA